MTPMDVQAQGIMAAGSPAFWPGVTAPPVSQPDPLDPSKTKTLFTDFWSGLSNGADRALKLAAQSASPFGGSGPITEGIAQNTKETVTAAANAANSAGKGISTGFEIVTIVIMVGLVLYVVAILSPFIPRRS